MKITGPKETILRARRLRKSMTKSERLLWWALRRQQTGHRFRRQHPAGVYVLDFYCDALRLCVEVDGEGHDFRAAHDERRDRWLRHLGIVTLRVSGNQVLSNLEGVVKLIVSQANDRAGLLQSPSGAARRLPQGGRS